MLERFKTLRGKFLFVLLVPVIIATVLVTTAVGIHTFTTLKNTILEKKESMAARNAELLKAPMWNFDQALVENLAASIAADIDVASVVVRNDQGESVVQIGTRQQDLVVRQPINQIGLDKTYTLGELEISFHLERIQEDVITEFIQIALLLLLLVVIILVSAAFANRWIVERPMGRLLRAIAKTEEYGVRDPVKWNSRDEIGDVITAYNTMQEKLGNEESNLIEARKIAEEASRAKSEFMSTVSHELRTPLTSIRGSLGLLSAEGTADLSDKARNMIDLAQRNSERLCLLIDDLLNLEKIQSGQMVFTMGAVDVGSLLAQAVESNQGYVERLNVSLTLSGGGTPPSVIGDQSRLLQVLANLISNAAKFSNVGGTVAVSWQERPLDRDGTPGVRISVADTGSGIPVEFQPRIFQPFAQADSSSVRAVGGTGLGLSISKVIVDFHHGNLSFDTEPGKGTTFHLDLPKSLER